LSRTRERSNTRPSETEDARNELFSHIHRCGVLRATPEQQAEWMKDTVEFLGERYSSLSDVELTELQAIGMRFCSPVIVSRAAEEAEAEAEQEPAAA
jgi:hypothetical protein